MPLSFYFFIHLSTHHDGTTEEALLQGEDDGEGHTWKVLRGRGGLIDIFYGRGSASKLRLRNEDKKSTPTEQLVLKRIRASC